MKFDWDQEKNIWLKDHRDVTFDEIVCLIEGGYLRAILENPKKPHQKIFVVERDGYAHNISFVEQQDGTCFLKTIYPSRVSTKKFIGGKL